MRQQRICYYEGGVGKFPVDDVTEIAFPLLNHTGIDGMDRIMKNLTKPTGNRSVTRHTHKYDILQPPYLADGMRAVGSSPTML